MTTPSKQEAQDAIDSLRTYDIRGDAYTKLDLIDAYIDAHPALLPEVKGLENVLERLKYDRAQHNDGAFTVSLREDIDAVVFALSSWLSIHQPCEPVKGLEIGQTWKTRGGWTAKVFASSPFPTHPFTVGHERGDVTLNYSVNHRANGFVFEEDFSDDDLVELLSIHQPCVSSETIKTASLSDTPEQSTQTAHEPFGYLVRDGDEDGDEDSFTFYTDKPIDFSRFKSRENVAVFTHPVQPDGGVWISREDAIRTIWRMAMTGAANIAIDEQNRSNDDDASCDILNAQGEIIRRLKQWLEIDPQTMSEASAALQQKQDGV